MDKVTASLAKQNFGQVLELAASAPVAIERHGKVVAAMVPLGAIRFAMIRRYAGVEYRVHGKVQKAEPVDEVRMFAEIALVRADLLAIVGIGGLAVVLWLMMMKPF